MLRKNFQKWGPHAGAMMPQGYTGFSLAKDLKHDRPKRSEDTRARDDSQSGAREHRSTSNSDSRNMEYYGSSQSYGNTTQNYNGEGTSQRRRNEDDGRTDRNRHSMADTRTNIDHRLPQGVVIPDRGLGLISKPVHSASKQDEKSSNNDSRQGRNQPKGRKRRRSVGDKHPNKEQPSRNTREEKSNRETNREDTRQPVRRTDNVNLGSTQPSRNQVRRNDTVNVPPNQPSRSQVDVNPDHNIERRNTSHPIRPDRGGNNDAPLDAFLHITDNRNGRNRDVTYDSTRHDGRHGDPSFDAAHGRRNRDIQMNPVQHVAEQSRRNPDIQMHPVQHVAEQIRRIAAEEIANQIIQVASNTRPDGRKMNVNAVPDASNSRREIPVVSNTRPDGRNMNTNAVPDASNSRREIPEKERRTDPYSNYKASTKFQTKSSKDENVKDKTKELEKSKQVLVSTKKSRRRARKRAEKEADKTNTAANKLITQPVSPPVVSKDSASKVSNSDNNVDFKKNGDTPATDTPDGVIDLTCDAPSQDVEPDEIIDLTSETSDLEEDTSEKAVTSPEDDKSLPTGEKSKDAPEKASARSTPSKSGEKSKDAPEKGSARSTPSKSVKKTSPLDSPMFDIDSNADEPMYTVDEDTETSEFALLGLLPQAPDTGKKVQAGGLSSLLEFTGKDDLVYSNYSGAYKARKKDDEKKTKEENEKTKQRDKLKEKEKSKEKDDKTKENKGKSKEKEKPRGTATITALMLRNTHFY